LPVGQAGQAQGDEQSDREAASQDVAPSRRPAPAGQNVGAMQLRQRRRFERPLRAPRLCGIELAATQPPRSHLAALLPAAGARSPMRVCSLIHARSDFSAWARLVTWASKPAPMALSPVKKT